LVGNKLPDNSCTRAIVLSAGTNHANHANHTNHADDTDDTNHTNHADDTSWS